MRELRRIYRYMVPYLGSFVVAAVCLALAGALMGVVVMVGKPLLEDVLGVALGAAGGAAPEASRGFNVLEFARGVLPLDRLAASLRAKPFVQVPILLVVVFLVRAVLLYFGEYLTNRAGASVIRDLRAELYEAVTFQSLRFFQQNPTGTILSRVLSDVARLQRLNTSVLADFVRVGTMAPALVVTALLHDWRVTSIVLVALPLLGWPLVRLGKRLRRASTRSQETMAEASSVLNEAVSGVKVVQGFGMERFEIARFRRALDRMLRADLKAGRAAALAPAVLELVGGLIGAVLFYQAGVWIHAGKLTGGDFLVVLMSLSGVFMSVRRLNQLNVEIQQGLAAAVRVFDFVDREREIRDAEGAIPLPPFSREIRFETVDFAYDDEKVLDGIDLTLRRGEVVALVGLSGSGKSTLANLVPRFYDPTAGAIRIDGHDLRRVTLESLRGQIGLVTQETVLFDDTVRNNVAYGRSDVPLEAVIEAARAAHAHEFVEKLPDGYDTRLGERGSRLSMGQRQRLAIARALLKDPPILILDEATSALDSESESLVQDALERLMAGRTSLVIAHRLATVRKADRIVVMDAGRIVETGTHRELLARGGVYARLHALQFADSGP